MMSKLIYLPSNDVLAEYYAIEDSLTVGVREKEEENVRLAELRDALLPRLMSGELLIADVDNV